MSEKSTYRVRLMRWGDSSSSGRTVTLKLPDDTEDHPFKGLSVGARNGQLMEMEITLIEGDLALKTLSSSAEKRPVPKTALPTKPATQNPVQSSVPDASGGRANTDTLGPPAADRPDNAMPRASINGGAATNPSEMPGASIGKDEYDAFANQMGQAAESLAAVAEEMGKAVDDNDIPEIDEDAPPPLTAGQKAVVRAVDLCKSIDHKRAGFFYFMMSRYPSVPNLPPEPGNWSRDAKVTRDRVCHHCDLNALDNIAEDKSARQRFEALEKEFERSERLR